jgi:superfamily II DNA/RNA helicase
MYDLVTVAEIKGAPPLEGLDVERLPQRLTEAYARVVSARISVLEGRDESTLRDIIDEITRLGYTYLSLVKYAPTPDVQKSAAFVAGSAFELLAIHSSSTNNQDFTATSICPTCSAALLFLLADATSDAVEVIRRLSIDDDDEVLQKNLKQAITCLASGDLVRLAELTQTDYGRESRSMTWCAVNVLYAKCLDGIQELGRALLGNGNIDAAITIFEQTKTRCIDDCSDLMTDYLPNDTQYLSTFPGPFWLASLLEIVSKNLFQNALIRIPIPNVANVDEWHNEIGRLAILQPYLWPNHKRIIEEHRYLNRGVSAVLGLPTGAGKTTLARLKAATTLMSRRKVLYLAPTHALVRQVTIDWREIFPGKNVQNSFLFDGEYAETESSELPDIAVMTPERCLALLAMAPEAFSDVGLVIIDECHILHAVSLDASYRATDAMYCLHRLFGSDSETDFLLMSAMIENTDDLAAWIQQQTGRRCASVRDEWKPTRQVRSCVIYSHRETTALQARLRSDQVEAQRTRRKSPGVAVKRALNVRPFGIFSLNQTWNTTQSSDYVVLPLSSDSVLLNANNFWGLTSNRNVVSATLAARLANADVKTIVFCQQVNHTQSIVQQVAEEANPKDDLILTGREEELRNRLIDELGAEDHIYGPVKNIAACHHGLLLAEEREWIEGLFARKDGIKVLVATPTLAQGMNLPAEAVIIAGDERFDAVESEQTQLEAHELLNAAGRAGRAGQHAQGFVLVVPGRVVDFDDERQTLGGRWFTLQQNVFSKSDQCLTIVDPLQRLIDAIHSGVITDDRPVQYILRRMPFKPGQTSEENVRHTMNRSFAAFMARRHGELGEFARKVDATVTRGQEIIQSVEIEEHQWLIPLATELGINAEVLLEINLHLDSIMTGWYANDYVRWSFENRIIRKMLKPQTLNDISTTLTTPAERRTIDDINEVGLNRLEPLLLLWIEGSPFNEIEVLAGTPYNRLAKCDIARKLALRWSVDVAYALGVITRLYRRRCDIREVNEMPSALATLAACIRQGVDLPAKLAILHIMNYDINRVRVHRFFEDIRSRLRDGQVFESFAETMRRVRIAMRRTRNR